MGRFDGKVALITGGARGQGEAEARRLVSEDDWQSAVAETVAAFGRLDVLINNAGILRVGTVEEMSLARVSRACAAESFELAGQPLQSHGI